MNHRMRCSPRSSALARSQGCRSVLSAVDVLPPGADVSPAGERLCRVNVALVAQQELYSSSESLKLHGGEILTVLFLELADEVLAEAVVSTDIEHVAEEGSRQSTSHDRDECHLDRGRDVLRCDPHSRLREDDRPDV